MGENYINLFCVVTFHFGFNYVFLSFVASLDLAKMDSGICALFPYDLAKKSYLRRYN